ncbi:MAG: SAM-dependent chlorinase/fluorinase, partial [Nitrospinota bacterium]
MDGSRHARGRDGPGGRPSRGSGGRAGSLGAGVVRTLRPIITLITDFGRADPYVGTMKGVMISINPVVRFIDITHEVTGHDVLEAALIL